MNLWITWGQNHRMGIIISKCLTQLCPGVEQSVDTKRGLWMLNHTHAHVQIWILLHPLSLNLIFKSKSNLSQSCSCLCPEDKSFPVIYAMAEKLTWDDFLMKITFCIFYTKNVHDHFSHLFLQQKHCFPVSKNWNDGPCLPTSTILSFTLLPSGRELGSRSKPKSGRRNQVSRYSAMWADSWKANTDHFLKWNNFVNA